MKVHATSKNIYIKTMQFYRMSRCQNKLNKDKIKYDNIKL